MLTLVIAALSQVRSPPRSTPVRHTTAPRADAARATTAGDAPTPGSQIELERLHDHLSEAVGRHCQSTRRRPPAPPKSDRSPHPGRWPWLGLRCSADGLGHRPRVGRGSEHRRRRRRARRRERPGRHAKGDTVPRHRPGVAHPLALGPPLGRATAAPPTLGSHRPSSGPPRFQLASRRRTARAPLRTTAVPSWPQSEGCRGNRPDQHLGETPQRRG
jgi:hypothetical protein